MTIQSRIAAVREKIDAAARKAGGNGDEVLLVAVSKTVGAETVAGAAETGMCHFGENYAQEFRDKLAFFNRNGKRADWHFVGRLQRNKVKYVVGDCRLIHSVDSVALASEIDKRAGKLGIKARVLVEINQGDPSKGGVKPDEAYALFEFVSGLENTSARGLMTMPPYSGSPDAVRPYFRELRELRDSLVPAFPDAVELSMGMSADFEAAVEEGATIVRVGSLIFGERRGADSGVTERE